MFFLLLLFVAILIAASLFARSGCAARPSAVPGATSSLIAGLVLSVVGVALLLDRFGLVHVENIWRFWPLFLIVPGVIKLSKGPSSRRIWGGFLVFFGTLLLLHEFQYFPYGWNYLWPLFLVFGGVLLMWQAFESKHDSQFFLGEDAVKVFSVFGGSEQHINSQTFRGGELVAVFGGYQLDLTQAEIEGTQAVIDATSVFGGGEIRIPRHWNVVMKGIGIFGGYGDETGRVPLDPTKPPKTLVVKGVAMFGGVAIKN
jgi:hypothetical protein